MQYIIHQGYRPHAPDSIIAVKMAMIKPYDNADIAWVSLVATFSQKKDEWLVRSGTPLEEIFGYCPPDQHHRFLLIINNKGCTPWALKRLRDVIAGHYPDVWVLMSDFEKMHDFRFMAGDEVVLGFSASDPIMTPFLVQHRDTFQFLYINTETFGSKNTTAIRRALPGKFLIGGGTNEHNMNAILCNVSII